MEKLGLVFVHTNAPRLLFCSFHCSLHGGFLFWLSWLSICGSTGFHAATFLRLLFGQIENSFISVSAVSPEHVVFSPFSTSFLVFFSVRFPFLCRFPLRAFRSFGRQFCVACSGFLRVCCFPACFCRFQSFFGLSRFPFCRFPKFLWIVSVSIVGFSFSTQACNSFRMLDFSAVPSKISGRLGKLPFKFSVPSISPLLGPRIVEIFAKCWTGLQSMLLKYCAVPFI